MRTPDLQDWLVIAVLVVGIAVSSLLAVFTGQTFAFAFFAGIFTGSLITNMVWYLPS